MKISGMSHQFLSSCVMASMLAGCGGSQSSINPPSARAPAITVHPDRSRSWMSPEAQSNDLLYVSNGSMTDLHTPIRMVICLDRLLALAGQAYASRKLVTFTRQTLERRKSSSSPTAARFP